MGYKKVIQKYAEEKKMNTFSAEMDLRDMALVGHNQVTISGTSYPNLKKIQPTKQVSKTAKEAWCGGGDAQTKARATHKTFKNLVRQNYYNNRERWWPTEGRGDLLFLHIV